MSKTAWVSDKIRPSYPQIKTQPNKQGKKQEQEVPKSKYVLGLESLAKGLRGKSSAKDPNGGCFCLAREHTISEYTPLCLNCGFILCSLNLPYYCCSSCGNPLQSHATRGSLVERVDSMIVDALSKEAAERERLVEQARQAAGAFPTLSGSAPGRNTPQQLQQPFHKVISLNIGSKTKKRTIKTVSVTPKSQPTTPKSEEQEEEIIRVPPPSREVFYAKGPLDPSRPWENLGGDNPKYIPQPKENSRRNRGSTDNNNT